MMQPTMKLRLIKRGMRSTVPIRFQKIGGPPEGMEPVLVLQQWFQFVPKIIPGTDLPEPYRPHGEWRDIPIEEEE